MNFKLYFEVQLQSIDPYNDIAQYFQLSELSKSNNPTARCDDVIDGWMWVDSFDQNGIQGDRYSNAIPTKFTLTDPNDDEPDVYYHSGITNLEQLFVKP